MWLRNMPIRSAVIGCVTAPALGVRDMLFFLRLWCFYRLYLSLLGDLWDLTEDKLWANRAGVPLRFLVSSGNSLRKTDLRGDEKRVQYFFDRFCHIAHLSGSQQDRRCAAHSAGPEHGCFSQTRTHFTGRLIAKSLPLLIPGGWILSVPIINPEGLKKKRFLLWDWGFWVYMYNYWVTMIFLVFSPPNFKGK